MSTKLTSRTPWRQKLEKPQEPKIVDVPPKMQSRWGTGKMLIATPLLVDAVIRKVPKRKLVTVNQIRERLAKKFQADSTCPLTTGIFVRIAAEATEEDRQMGNKQVTPYWRVVRDDGSLIPNLPGGVESQAQHLREEGHTIEPGKGNKPPKVTQIEASLVKW